MVRDIFVAVAGAVIAALIGFTAERFFGALSLLLGPSVPSGAVVAFDRSDLKPDNCPDGWEPFADARGRVIIGSSKDYPFRVPGGLAKYKLQPGHMPAHSHTVRDFEWGYDVSRGTGSAARIDVDDDHPWEGRTGKLTTTSTGKSSDNILEIDNRPPYIPLYFCMKK
ncbi:MAG: hypothetical protein F4103_02725 [Boseongicola sp. SB0673_bin_14]|nr:hypothetical protein [Boseongicola sp. SB0673_bin_14]